MATRFPSLDRVQHVELRLAAEFLCVAFLLLYLLPAAMPPLTCETVAGLAVALIVAAGWSVYRRWRLRLARWRSLTDWRTAPIRRNGPLVLQVNSAGEPTGAIDTRERYTVTWERFDARRAVYTITHRDKQIVVSTLAPNAPEILRDALSVRNYPCEEWPNFDL